MAVRDLAGCMANVRSMLSGLSQWQAICDVDNAADAAERIHYGGVDELATEGGPTSRATHSSTMRNTGYRGK